MTFSGHLPARGSANRLDPFVIEVIRNALTAAAEEMSAVVMRSARSPLLREAGDLSSVLTDAQGELIAQGHDVPVHLGVLSFTVKSFLSVVPESSLRPGDIWFLNLPEIGGNHLPDVKAIRPVYHEGDLVCFAVSLAHWADIGGATPGSYYAAASDAWMEGLRISPLRVFANDRIDTEKLSMILSNVRGQVEREGDLLAQAAATRTGGRRVVDIIERYGKDVFLASLAALHDLSEAKMRGLLSKLPDGIFEGEDFLDDDGRDGDPVAIRVRIEKRGDTACFDFSDSDDAVIGPLNTTRFVAGSAVFYAIRALADSEIQPNGGCYRPLKIVTRPGSVVDTLPEKPLVGGNHETSQRMVDAIFLALSGIVGEKLSAGGYTSAGLVIFSGLTAGGRWLTFYETHGGGEGARIDRDGYPVVRVHLTNVMSTPVEVVEAEYPMLRIERQALREGSGGDGAHRGGDGMIRDYRIMAPNVTVTTMFERRVIPPYGLEGGEAGATMRVIHTRAGQERMMAGKENAALSVGDLIRVETSGGGGYGRKGP